MRGRAGPRSAALAGRRGGGEEEGGPAGPRSLVPQPRRSRERRGSPAGSGIALRARAAGQRRDRVCGLAVEGRAGAGE